MEVPDMDEKTVMAPRAMKSPGLAGVLSFFLPFGVGALYNEQKNKALIQFIIFGGLVYAIVRGGNAVVFGLGIAAFYFYQVFDNIQSARAINAAASGQPAETAVVPQDAAAAGSVFWGIVLIALGVVLILANFEIIPYRTLGNYWPVAAIVIGLKLVADAVTRSKKDK
jgi:TM2 domain-containing membrane protein YozV